MNVKTVQERKIAADAVKMTLLSLAMQTAGMIFNVFLSGKAGTAAVGLMSLTFNLFSFIMVLANGNILTSTGRFVSEARGAGHENYSRLMRYALTFSGCLSVSFMVISLLLSRTIGTVILKSEIMTGAVRLIALSLPFASAGSCIKGYFNGIRQVSVAMTGDLVEFVVKWAVLFGGLLLFGGTEHFYLITAAGILAGEAVSFCYYMKKYVREYRRFSLLPVCTAPLLTDTPAGYIKNTFPILLSGYVQMLLSTANELLVPTALLAYSKSSEEALAGYGCFEAMIMPAMFFPSAVLTSLAGIIIPEAALANRSDDPQTRLCRLGTLTDSSFSKCFSYAFFVAVVFFYCGEQLGTLLCPSDPIVGSSLKILAPVIPFIYLEIILEGLLKGMGRQNFSTVNSLAEYAVRIACVIFFVGRIGFGGVLISYYASNILSNIARIIVVCQEAALRFDVKKYILRPLIRGLICCEAGRLAVRLTHAAAVSDFAVLAVFIMTSVTVFALFFPLKQCRLRQGRLSLHPSREYR